MPDQSATGLGRGVPLRAPSLLTHARKLPSVPRAGRVSVVRHVSMPTPVGRLVKVLMPCRPVRGSRSLQYKLHAAAMHLSSRHASRLLAATLTTRTTAASLCSDERERSLQVIPMMWQHLVRTVSLCSIAELVPRDVTHFVAGCLKPLCAQQEAVIFLPCMMDLPEAPAEACLPHTA